MTGETLGGRYRLDRLIGRGGMAEVWAAHDEILNRTVAVKLLLDRYSQDDQFVERFRREAQNAASLNHPNIVAVYDTGQHGGLPFIVMELVRGRSLQEAIRTGGLTEDRALEVCAEVCSALDYAHSRGLVHRDVKPGNILLAEDGSVKVTDFGIARAIDADTVTQTAAVLGTAAYLSPEQAQGQPVDARSDVYSLGVVLYEVLTGHQPFEGDTPVTVAYQHVQELPRPPRDWDPTISSAAEAIAVRAMAKNPVNRYQLPEEMRQDLLRARVGEPVSAPAVMRDEDTAIFEAVPMSSPEDEPSERRKRAIGYTLLALLSIAAAAAAVIYLGTLFGGEETARREVPDVTGMSFEQASGVLEARGFVPRYAGSEFDDELESGRIVRQQPPQGSQQPEGEIIRLWESRGREQVTVPDVSGMEESEALKALRDAGLVPSGRSTEFDPDTEKGTLLRTRPAAGERVPKNTQIDYVVSAGEETVRVLRVEGLSESDARFELEDQGFTVLVLREFSDTVDEGIVIRQDPEPGTELEKGAEVTIVVSKGPQEPSPSPSPTSSDPLFPPPGGTDEPTSQPTSEPSPTPTDGG